MDKVVGRLAPSPTGALHLGNARTFLLAWLSVRARGGKVILRIEDLDHPKVKKGATQGILEDLSWLGLDWDEGPDIGGPSEPYIQTQRLPLYREALHRLREINLAYPCICSRADLEDAQSAPHGRNPHTLAYPGTCRGRFRTWEEAVCAIDPERLPVWRFDTRKLGGRVMEFTDIFMGHRELELASEIGDFAIARHIDGAGYQLACTLDDSLMGVTEVVRGDDLVDATFCQIAIAEALGLRIPKYCHVPLVVGPDGRRLAKRHGDTRISTLRQQGYTPERVVGALAVASGLTTNKLSTPRELIQTFSFNKLSSTPLVFTGFE